MMITDFMLESLVLMRYDLCMTVDDICFFSKNVSGNKTGDSGDNTGNITDNGRAERIANWQYLDVMVCSRSL